MMLESCFETLKIEAELCVGDRHGQAKFWQWRVQLVMNNARNVSPQGHKLLLSEFWINICIDFSFPYVKIGDTWKLTATNAFII